MFFFYYFLLAALAFTCCVILFQDFKQRQVSLWLLILFGVICIASVIYLRDLKTLLYNVLFAIVYIGFIWLILKLYLFLKFKKNTPVMNELLGPADIIVMMCLGFTFNLPGLIYFFCFGFVVSLVFHLLYSSFGKNTTHKTVPLAGYLVICYLLSIIILYLVGENYYVDCSFVNYE